MANPTKVLIHSQGNSEGPLREAIDYYRPNMIFLICNHGATKASLIYKHLEDRNETKLAQTQSLKKSLMQDLLTGKVRVQVN